jgi:hypothetical protein
MRSVVITVLVLLFLVAALAAFVITLLKGKWRLGLGLWILGLGLFVWPVTAIRLAIPTSWWARRFYTGENADKLEDAWRRFGPRIQKQKEREARFLAAREEYARQRERSDRPEP